MGPRLLSMPIYFLTSSLLKDITWRNFFSHVTIWLTRFLCYYQAPQRERKSNSKSSLFSLSCCKFIWFIWSARVTRYYLMTQYDESDAALGRSSPLPAPWSSFWSSWTWARAEAHPQLPWLWTEAFNWNLSRTQTTFDCKNRVSPSLLFLSVFDYVAKKQERNIAPISETGMCSILDFLWLTMITIIATSDGPRPYVNTTIITKISDTSFRLFTPCWVFSLTVKFSCCI